MAQPKTKGKAPVTRSKARNSASNSKTTKLTRARGRKGAVASTNRKRPVTDDEESDSSSSDATSHRRPRKKRSRRAQQPEPEIVDDEEPEASEIEVVEDDRDKESSNDEEGGGEAGPDSDDEEAGDNLQPKHHIPIPSAKAVKKQSTRDLLLMMTDIVEVKFKVAEDEYKSVKGRWCITCKSDTAFLAKHGKRKAFHTGGNSSCRQHLRQHYDVYQKKCIEANIPENHWVIPRDIWREMEEEKHQKNKKKVQRKIEFERLAGPRVFSQEAVLHSVTQLIAVDDQSLALADKAVFRNCLVSMRPNSTKADLPSTHDVTVYLHNQFIERLNELKTTISNAPGKVSITADGWTADTTKAAFLGMTGHWIDVVEGKWKLRAEVIAFQGLSGNHTGLNLGRYLVGCCDRIGIMSPEDSKLYAATLDNTSTNTTICETVEDIHLHRALSRWDAGEGQLPCLGHVVNIANVAVMASITKIAAVETATAIWEYDPTDPDNRVLGGSLDVIAAIRTLAIKMQVSGQRIEYFENCQIQCKITDPLKIPLHSNIRWGTAHDMLNRARFLRQPMTLFVSSADELYGPITTLRHNGRVYKHIPWTAFKLSDTDWDRVEDAVNILTDSNHVQQYFSAEKQPTLWRALPALEELQTAWEEKRDDQHYALYKEALEAGLAKLNKYYSLLDEKPAIVLAITLHPYYKLTYIKHAWGGEEEQAAEIAAGNPYAKNWQDEALKVVQRTMQEYWKSRPRAQDTTQTPAAPLVDSNVKMSEFDRHRQTLVSQDDQEGWAGELRRYLKDIPVDITKETDIVEWWQDHCQLYPTLARIALDVLPAQASSVPCERLFSGSKQTATDRRARLGSQVFEQLQILKFTWRNNITDLAAWNSGKIEDVNLLEFNELLHKDEQDAVWDKDGYEIVVS